MDTIIFICTGNTCRSPMAEGLFRARGGEELTGLQAESAGLFTEDGLPPTENAVIAAGEFGADISGHRSRYLTMDMVREAKYLVCMTGTHYDMVRVRCPGCEEKLFTLLPEDIPDPFGGNLEVYRQAAAAIEKGIKSIIERLGNEAN